MNHDLADFHSTKLMGRCIDKLDAWITTWSTVIVILLGLRSVNTNPKFLAAETRAFSSGDWAWYSSFPADALLPALRLTYYKVYYLRLYVTVCWNLWHNSVTKGQQSEELTDILFTLSYILQQGFVIELKVRVVHGVEWKWNFAVSLKYCIAVNKTHVVSILNSNYNWLNIIEMIWSTQVKACKKGRHKRARSEWGNANHRTEGNKNRTQRILCEVAKSKLVKSQLADTNLLNHNSLNHTSSNE